MDLKSPLKMPYSTKKEIIFEIGSFVKFMKTNPRHFILDTSKFQGENCQIVSQIHKTVCYDCLLSMYSFQSKNCVYEHSPENFTNWNWFHRGNVFLFVFFSRFFTCPLFVVSLFWTNSNARKIECLPDRFWFSFLPWNP